MNTAIKTTPALLKREYWEHRGAFRRTPLILGSLFLVGILIFWITAIATSVHIQGMEYTLKQGIREMAKLPPDTLATIWNGVLMNISLLFLMVLFIVVFFYLLGSLYDDRKDGSILFWKSLPLSDTQTVLSKLLTAIVVAPAFFVAIAALTQLLVLVLASLIFWMYGGDPISSIWKPVDLLGNWWLLITGAFLQMMWALPIYGWLLLVSAWAKRRPFLQAVFIPMLVAFGWYWYNVLTSLSFTKGEVFSAIFTRLGHAMIPYAKGAMTFNSNQLGNDPAGMAGRLLTELTDPAIYSGLAFAAVTVALAIWVRRYRNTT